MLLAIAVLSSGVPHRLRHESSVMELEREAELELDGLASMLERMDKMEKLIEKQAAEIQLLKADQIAVCHSLAGPHTGIALSSHSTGPSAHQAQALERSPFSVHHEPLSRYVVGAVETKESCNDDGEYVPAGPPTCKPRKCTDFSQSGRCGTDPTKCPSCPMDRCKLKQTYGFGKHKMCVQDVCKDPDSPGWQKEKEGC